MKNYSHCPRQAADIELIRARQLMKEKPDFYNLEKDGTFKQLNNHSPRRRLEFNSANHFYLCDVAKYLCTHHKDKLSLGAINYIETALDWDIFLKLAIGQYKNQYQKFMEELRNSQRYCYIPRDSGGYYIMPPFRLDFTTESLEDLSERQLRKLKNIEAQKIKSVTFSMAKPIFEKYIKGGQYYKHPINLYAKIYDKLNEIIKAVKNSDLNALRSRGFDLDIERDFTCPIYVSGYVRLIDCLYIRGAGTKDKISVSLQDLLPQVMPSLCHINEQGKMKLRNRAELEDFLTVAATLTGTLDGLDYKLKPVKVDTEKDGCIIFEFDHPNKKNNQNS